MEANETCADCGELVAAHDAAPPVGCVFLSLARSRTLHAEMRELRALVGELMDALGGLGHDRP